MKRLLITLFAGANIASAQDIAIQWVFTDTMPYSSGGPYFSLSHYPTKKDRKTVKKHRKLITSEPRGKNCYDYYSTACSLWELGRKAEAEKMFLKILDSNEPVFAGTSYHSSDIPGDTSVNTYGYGSFTSNLKNSACTYLAETYLEDKKFEKALDYTIAADKKYVVQYNCGTGNMRYRNQINGYYVACYEGLERYDSIFKAYLPEWQNWGNSCLTNAIKKLYSEKEIREQLKLAENSIVFTPDTFQSLSTTTYNYGEKDERTEETQYTSGTATMKLFGTEVYMYPEDLKNGEKATREHIVRIFRRSSFYNALAASN